MRALAVMAFLAIMPFTLGGCGQKGPLYMPEKPAEPPQETTSNRTNNQL